MPLYGLNSVLDTLVAQTAGSIGEDQNIIELCGIYLIRGRTVMALFYGPLMILLSLSQRLWPRVWRVPSLDIDGSPCNVGDDLAIHHATTFVSSFFIGTFFCCLNDLQIRFLNAVGKYHLVAISQSILFLAFIPISYLIIVKGGGGIYAAGQVSLYFQVTLFASLLFMQSIQEDLKPA